MTLRGVGRRVALLAELATASLVVGCGITGSGSIPAGAYVYTGYDSGGAVVVRGWLALDLRNPSRVTGTWHLEEVGDPPEIGPQVGDGELEGEADGSRLFINLNPRFADNNVWLTGTLESRFFRGDWSYSTLAGPRNQGRFAAVKR